MKITTAPSSNPKNGRAWRDLHQTDAAFSPAYIGEAKDQETANLFVAAPDMLAALERIADGQWPTTIAETPGTLAMREVARAAIRKARGNVS